MDSPSNKNQWLDVLKKGLSGAELRILEEYLSKKENALLLEELLLLLSKNKAVNEESLSKLKDYHGVVNQGLASLNGSVVVNAEKSAGRDMIINTRIGFKWPVVLTGIFIVIYVAFSHRLELINYFRFFEKFEDSNYNTFNIALIPFKQDINVARKQESDFMDQLVDRLNVYSDTSSHVKIKYYINKFGVSSHKDAYAFGTSVNADLVIWGTYSMNNDSTNVRMCYSLLKEIGLNENSRTSEKSTNVSTINLTSLLRQGSLPNNVFFVLNWVKGMDLYFKGNYKKAIYFIDQIANDKSIKLDIETSALVGNIYKDLGKYEIALKYLNLNLTDSADGITSPDSTLIEVYRSVGFCHASLQHYDEAKKFYTKAEKIAQLLQLQSKECALLFNDIGILNKDIGLDSDPALIDSSIAYYNKSIKIWRACSDTNSYSYILTLNNLAVSLDVKYQLKEAKECHEKSIKKFETYFSVDKPQLATLYNNYAKHCLLEGDTVGAEKHLLLSVEYMEEGLDPLSLNLAGGYNNLSKVYFAQKKYKLSLSYALKSLDILNNLEEHEKFREYVIKNIYNIYLELNQPEEAAAYLKKIPKSK